MLVSSWEYLLGSSVGSRSSESLGFYLLRCLLETYFIAFFWWGWSWISLLWTIRYFYHLRWFCWGFSLLHQKMRLLQTRLHAKHLHILLQRGHFQFSLRNISRYWEIKQLSQKYVSQPTFSSKIRMTQNVWNLKYLCILQFLLSFSFCNDDRLFLVALNYLPVFVRLFQLQFVQRFRTEKNSIELTDFSRDSLAFSNFRFSDNFASFTISLGKLEF